MQAYFIYLMELADVRFLDSKAVPAMDEMKWWLPKQLNVLDKKPGGPYEQFIPLEDRYLLLSTGEGNGELVKVGGLKVGYYVQRLDMSEIVMHGEEAREQHLLWMLFYNIPACGKAFQQIPK